MCSPSCHPLTAMLTRTRADAPVPGNGLSKTSWPPTLSCCHPVTLLNPRARGQHTSVARPSPGSIFTSQLPPDGHRALGALSMVRRAAGWGQRKPALPVRVQDVMKGTMHTTHPLDTAGVPCPCPSCLPTSCLYALKSGGLEARPLPCPRPGLPPTLSAGRGVSRLKEIYQRSRAASPVHHTAALRWVSRARAASKHCPASDQP